MTFVTQFNYFKKSIDSIFYSTPQIFGKRIRDASIYTSKKISLKFLFLSDIFLFPFIRQQFPVLT